jgi:glycerate 2-kinase
MHILIAPNAFKNSLDAEAAAIAISNGFLESRLSCSTTCFPLGDGGDGTVALLLKHLNGKTIPSRVHDPLGREINSFFGLIDGGKTALIELAAASGLKLLKVNEYGPLHTTTRGTGEMIKQALDLDIRKIILAIGGSATVDAGCGILNELGVEFFCEGKPCSTLPKDLINLTRIDLSGLDPRILNIELIILCDVENTLLGNLGAAPVFGPQKGARGQDVALLEAGLHRLCSVAKSLTGEDMATVNYGGAAGGVAAGLSVFLNAKPVIGIDYFLEHTGFDHQLQKAKLLITAEGSLDSQTIAGKGPLGAAKRAKLKGIPVIGLAGKVPLEIDDRLISFFDVLLPISHEPMTLAAALENTASNLTRTARAIGDLLSIL